MPYATVTLTGKVTSPTGAASRNGFSIMANTPRVVDAAGKVVVLAGSVSVQPDATGAFSVALPATDDVNLTPSGFQYRLLGPHGIDMTFSLPTSLGTVDLAELVPVSPAPVSAESLTDATVKALVDSATSGTSTSLAKFRQRADATSWPIWMYGNSLSVLSSYFFSSGKHWTQQLATRMGGGTITSYGISGKRVLDVLSALIQQQPFPGLSTVPLAGAKWPGTSSRQGLVILEMTGNDFGHYPSMVGVAIPAALPTGNTRYSDSIAAMYRAALAIVSSESRVENTQRTATSGTWTHDSPTAYASSGSLSFTSAAGAYVEYSVTPPQSGPLAGKVFMVSPTLDPGTGVMAQQTIAVDGTAQLTRTPSGWEQYQGPAAGQVAAAVDCVAITLPIDNAAHTIRVTHAGAGGQFMYQDFIAVPSIDPNPVIVPGMEHTTTGTGLWTAAQVATWHANVKALTPVMKAVVAEFPNAMWVTSTITTNGLYSGDGLHPNDRGMAQRANDVFEAAQSLKARLDNRALKNSADSNFQTL